MLLFTERLGLIFVYKMADLLLILWRIRSQSALKWIINLSVCYRVKSLVAQPACRAISFYFLLLYFEVKPNYLNRFRVKMAAVNRT